MKTDIILAGVGGQGIISIAAVIGMASLSENLFFKQAEVHGMSQRGGAVQSHFRLSDKEIASDLVPVGGADLIISVEPMESLRYLPYLKSSGWLVTNTKPFVNITDYPEMDSLLKTISSFKNHVALDANKVAEELGSPRSSNIVMLGAASPFINIPFASLEDGIRKIFGGKGEQVVSDNLKALNAGRAFADSNK